MCDRIGCTHFPKLSEMDFTGAAAPSRRRFLKGAAAATTISMGLGGALAGPAHDTPLPRRPLVIEGRGARLLIRLLSDQAESRLLLERLSSPIPPVSLEEPFALTGREAEVMAWVAQGKTNAEVARIVHAQPRTIEKHLERIYKKLGVDNRFAAILAVMSQIDRG